MQVLAKNTTTQNNKNNTRTTGLTRTVQKHTRKQRNYRESMEKLRNSKPQRGGYKIDIRLRN